MRQATFETTRGHCGSAAFAVFALLAAILVALAWPASVRASEILIPGDYPAPGPGERVTAETPPGAAVRIDPAAIDIASVEIAVEGEDLVLRLPDGGAIVLAGFLRPGAPEATLLIGDAPPIPASALMATADPQSAGDIEPAAGPSAAGGGEIFGFVRVASWLLDRLDPIGEAAAETAGSVAADASMAPGRFEQMRAQLLVAREAALLDLAREYLEKAKAFAEELAQAAAAGASSAVDVEQGRMLTLEAEIETRDAAHRLALAADAHEDAYGYRLEAALFPEWAEPPPDDLDAVRAGMPDGLAKAARAYWRRAAHGRETLELVDRLVATALAVRNAVLDQFKLGRRSTGEAISILRVVYEAQVQQANRRADKLVAEAWILAARGALGDAYIRRP